MLLLLLASLETEEERLTLTNIYDEHKYALLATAFKICHNQQMAEDAVHNAFEQLIKKNKEDMYLPRIDFRCRYVIIVKNKAIDLMRREKIYSVEAIEDLDYKFETDEIPIDVQVSSKEEYANLRKHLRELDDTSKLILEMKYVLNMSHKEIGNELGMSPEHVNTKIARAKGKIRKAMGKEARDDD